MEMYARKKIHPGSIKIFTLARTGRRLIITHMGSRNRLASRAVHNYCISKEMLRLSIGYERS